MVARLRLEVNGKAVSGGFDITPRKGLHHRARVRRRARDVPQPVDRELPSAGAFPAD